MNAASRSAGRIAAADPGEAADGRVAPSAGPADADAWGLLEAVGDGVLVLERVADSSLRIVWASASFHALAGLGALAGRTPDFVRCHDTQRPLGELLAAGDGEPLQRARLDIDTASWRQVAAASIRRSGTRHVVTLTLDAIDWHALTALELPFGMLVFSPDMRVRWANEAAAVDAGMPREQLVGSDWYALVPEAITRADVFRDALANPGRTYSRELVPLTFPGRETGWFRVHYRAVAGHGGATQALVVLAENRSREHAAAQALAISEERFRLAAQAVDGIIYECELATGTVSRSCGLAEVLGLDPEQLAPTIEAWLARIHPDDRLALDVVFDPPSGAGDSLERHYRVRHAQGHYIEIWDRARVHRDANGRAVRLVGCAVDVTRERRVERLLAEAQSTARVGSWEVDVETGRVEWSDETYRIYGVSRGDFVPTVDCVLRFFTPESRAELEAAIARAHATGEPWEIDCELDAPRGHRWLRSTGRVDRVDGRVLRMYGSTQDIDALKRTQIRLQQRSDWLQLAIDAAKLTVWRWDVAGEHVSVEYASDGMQRDGAPQPTVEGWLSLVHPDDRGRLRDSLMRTKNEGMLTDEEFRMQRPPDGDWGWFVARAVRAQEPEGLVVTGTTSDVTERRRAEDGVRASEATLRSIAEHSPDVVTIVDARLRVAFTNRPPPGSTLAEVVGRPAREFAVGHGALLERNLRHVLTTGESRTYSSWRFDADDQPRYYEHRLGPIRSGDEIQRAIVFSTDVTERIRAERRLRTQASVLATMREGVAVLDASGIVRLTNAAFDRMFGYEPGSLDGRGFETLTDDGILPAVEVGQAGFEFVGLRADGSRFDAVAAASALELGGERHDVYVVQDVTERRTLERELLEISNREQRRIGSDLHDGLGQELTGIALLLKVMAGRAKRSIAPTGAEIEEVVSLVNGAIEGTRALARGLSPVDLERGGLVYALRLLASRAKDLYAVDVRFRSRLQAPLTLAPAATTHLYRIAQEALTNAARHAQAEHVLVQLASRGRSVTLSITDDGRGVADGAALRTGMGLRIMRYRAHMMNGEVVVEAAAPRGTRVVCRVTQPEAAMPTPEATP